MWAVILLVFVGLALGLYLNIPIASLDPKLMAVVFLAILDGLTFGLAHDLQGLPSTNRLAAIRLLVSLTFGCFVIFFGEKSGLDLYLVALLPITFGVALNLYKFMPK